MTPTTEFPKLLDLALAEVQQKTRELITTHGLDKFPQWEHDAANGAIIFRTPGLDEFVVPAQLIGYHHPAQSLWQWAWDDPAVPANFVRSATAARNWGRAQDIEAVASPTTFADEALAWRLTAFAARLTGWPAIYRGQSESRFLYFAFAVITP
ncbi:DUF6882 domain-containing protein [Limnoglobus roseus]|uniref:Uncharacterized protein n=1 Tax=Limnoglobus roseus TaxID=2598579 RepID=A0A5C1AA43_9BACT|nr:DUF6882 domain-containing protein [Limnoglobus roseus]QEL15043.1 hypothetical protein PX52LOC_01949 [Limnoglobus roseus]